MNFPTRELEIVRLAQDVSTGLAANADAFPAPPAASETIVDALAAYNLARETAIAASASATMSTALKDEALKALTDLVKADVKYAESMTRGDDARLQLIGWGPRRSRSPSDLTIPGQVITLEVRQEGKNWVTLAWKQPFDGGEVSAYRVQRRKRDAGDWVDVGTSVETVLTLNGQDPGVEFEYQVIAMNKAGEGPVSNVVRAVL